MADPTPQQLAKALTLNERMSEWAKRFDPNYRRVRPGMKFDEYQKQVAEGLGVTGWLTQGPPQSEFSRPADLPSGMFERDAAKLGRGARGLFNSAIDGLAKAGLSFGFVNNGGVLTDNEITDTALNTLGGGSTFSKAIGAKAVGGPGGKVLGANVPGSPPHRWLPSHQKEAWDQIPSVAEKVKARMENELGVPVTISQSDTNYGRSWYVKPQIESFTGEGPFSVRVSDHGANARPQEARIYMVDGPTRTVATPEYVDAQIEKAIEFAKTYKARNSSPQPLPTDTASRMARAEEMGFNADVYPQAKAQATAQRNAAKPASEGGLGLGPNNTPMERAKAMGFEEGFHLSRQGVDVNTLDSGKFATAPFDAVGTHIGSKDAIADRWASLAGRHPDDVRGVTYPVLFANDKPFFDPSGKPWGENDLDTYLRSTGGHNRQDVNSGDYRELNNVLREKVFANNTSIPYLNDVEAAGTVSHIVPPQNIRSRFAAFDPAKADSADLLAMTGNPTMLAAGQNQDRPGPPKMALELAKRLRDQEFYAKGGI